MSSSDESVSIAQDLLALAERWEVKLSDYRVDSAARRLPRFLIGYPALSVGQAAKALELSVPTANGAFKNLVDAGILRQLDKRKRNCVFLAPEVFERLDRPPG